MVSQYEKERARNIENNKALLKSLGLDIPAFEPKEKARKPKGEKKKRKATVEVEDTTGKPNKIPRFEEEGQTPPNTIEDGVRRSSRIAGKTVDYTAEITRRPTLPLAYTSGVKVSENEGKLGREDGIRKHNPKTYGSIPGIEVGTWWETRKGCSIDAIHAPYVAGISGGPDGAHSVALSGGYDDDVDLGYAFTYTGSGGRDLKGTKDAPKNLRTAPQSSDQSFDNPFNKMMKRSCETTNPVRVIRGFKLKSEYAPSEGYRYDGLYRVEKAWIEKGLMGFLMCKYVLKRLPNQPPLPILRSEQDADDTADLEEPELIGQVDII